MQIRIHATIRMRIPARKRKEVRNTLGALVERIKLEEGCLSCRLYEDAMDGKALMFEEIWADEQSLQKHLRSNEFRTVLLMVEMASEPPEIRFDRVSGSTDLKTIMKMRRETGGLNSEKSLSSL